MSMEQLHFLLIGLSLGISASILIAVMKDKHLPPSVRALVAAVSLGGAAHGFATAHAVTGWNDGVAMALRWVSFLGMVALWQLVRQLFDEKREGWPVAVAALVATVAVVLTGIWLQRRVGLSWVIQPMATVLVLHVFWMLLRGRGGDLDSIRRRLRLWWVAAAGLYVVTVLLVHQFPWEGADPARLGIASVVGQMSIKLGWLLMASGHPSVLATLSVPVKSAQPVAANGGFAAKPSAEPPPAANPVGERAVPIEPPQEVPHTPQNEALKQRQAERICDAMTREHLYQQAGLTVSALAQHMRMPEARLRLVIHEQLGYRHFNAFLNRYRLAEVATRLRNPADAHLPVLTLALEAGFGSIGPFNRAFREAHGVTPSDFRKGLGQPAAPPQAENSNPLAETLTQP